MIAEELQVIIDAHVENAKRELHKFAKQMETTTKKASGMGDALKTVGSIAGGFLVAQLSGKALGAMKAFAGESVRLASTAEEIESKFNVTFADAGGANKAVREFADAFDLADSTAQTLLASTGDLLTGFGFLDDQALEMSETVNALAVDLASFQNLEGGAARASQALTSALLGETEAAKSLGIVIRQNTVDAKLAERGLEDLTGEAKLQAEAQARLEIAISQSQNALGDYERTADSYQNTARRAAENSKRLKEELGERMLPVLGTVKDAWGNLIGRMADAIERTNDLRKVLKILKEGGDLSDVETDTLNNSLEEAKSRLEELQRMRTGVAAGLETPQIKQQKKVIEAIKEEIAAKEDLAFIDKINAGLANEAERRRAISANLSKAEAEERAKAAEEHRKDMEALVKEYNRTEEAQIQNLRLLIAYFETFKQGPMAVAVLKNLREELEQLEGSTDKTSSGQLHLSDVFDRETDEVKESIEEIKAAIEKGLEEAFDQAIEKAKDYGQMVGMVFGHMRRVVDQYYDARLARVEEGSEKEKEVLREQAQAQKTLSVFNALINGAQAVIRAFATGGPALAAIVGGLVAAETAFIMAQPVPKFGEGGYVDKPTLAMVGEKGPEYIVPARKMGGGGGSVVIVKHYHGSIIRERKDWEAGFAMASARRGAF
jgi:hypothetical protein